MIFAVSVVIIGDHVDSAENPWNSSFFQIGFSASQELANGLWPISCKNATYSAFQASDYFGEIERAPKVGL